MMPDQMRDGLRNAILLYADVLKMNYLNYEAMLKCKNVKSKKQKV